MEKDYKAIFAKNLKALMKDMSQNELSRQTGIPQQTISRYLLCQHEVTLTNLCKIADHFEESVDDLLDRDKWNS